MGIAGEAAGIFEDARASRVMSSSELVSVAIDAKVFALGDTFAQQIVSRAINVQHQWLALKQPSRRVGHQDL